MKAIVLAGGFGTRLRPLSCTRPKLLFPIANKPLLDWTLERLAKSGVEEVVLAVNYMAEAFVKRYGNFTYTIPVAQGRYRLTLKFTETYFGPTNPAGVGPGMRLFDVYCNGQTLLKDFDIAREAGGVSRSLNKVFHGLRPNAQGKLVLAFVPVKNYACVNAIEIVPES